MVCKFENVSFRYVTKLLLDNVSFSFTDSDKIGIMGINGTGKSTLLKLIVGIEKPTSGQISKTGNMRINYLEQLSNFDSSLSVFDAINQYSTEKEPIQDYEIRSTLNKFKLTNHEAKCSTLSGGEKKRLAIAIALLKPCDVLILDEPTNHLDAQSILWLEKFLIKFPKGVILVTHDRYFLERVCNKMIELDHSKIYEYNANYSKYLEYKEQRLEEQNHNEQKVKSILRKELVWIKAGAQARSTKQKSRIQRFEEMSKIKFEHNKDMNISSVKTRLGNKTIELENASKSVGGKLLFKDFNFSLSRDARIGVVGENGCGKSTLFKIIMEQEYLDSGKLILGETIRIGYLSQELKEMNGEDRVIDYIKDEAAEIDTLDGKISAKSLLEQFLFDSDKQYSKIKTLSGGEKKRLQLVKVLITNPNILILDEPTNDLDIYTLELLENYLDTFYGPVLVVSHDRYFLDKVCDTLLIFSNQNINPFIGQYSDYLSAKKDDSNISNKVEKEVKTVNSFPNKLKNELNNIVPQIEKLEARQKELEKLTQDDSLDYDTLMKYVNEKDQVDAQLEEKTMRYFELLEIKESYAK